ncbi:MAG: hypothetical protein R2818_15625 [Flavobacteriales bacterium]
MALLNITNFDDHPQEPLWMVFRFATAQMAQEFTQGLDAARIRYEVDPSGVAPFLVGVRQHDREAAVRINYTVLGRYREPFIANKGLRWGVLGLLALLTALVVAGIIMKG